MSGLVTLGETMALLVSAEVGALRHQPHLHLRIGGAESNVAIAVARLGGRAAWIGRVGEDELGELVLATIRGEGVDVGHAVVDTGAPTGLMIKSRRTATVARLAYYRAGSAGSRLAPADVPADVVRSAGVLHVTGITPALSASARAATFGAVEEARAAGVPVSLDVNHRAALWSADEAASVLRDLAARADILFAGDDEAELLLGAGADARALLLGLGALGPATVVLKLGARGALALIDGSAVEVPPLPVVAIDPVGAGDAFVGGYLAELLAGGDAKARLATAAACGAFAVTVHGDWEGAPSRGDLTLLASPSGTVVR